MRWLLYILVGLLLTVTLALGIVRFAPATAIAAANVLQSSVKIEAENPTISFFPPRLTATSLSIDGEAFEVQGQAAALSVDLQDWWDGAPFWSLRAEHIVLMTREDQSPPAAEEGSAPTGIDLSPAFTFTRIDIDVLAINDQTFRVAARNDRGVLEAEVTSENLNATASIGHQHAHEFSVVFNQNDIRFAGAGQLHTLPQPEINLSTGSFNMGTTSVTDLRTLVSCAPSGLDCEVKNLQANVEIENLAPIRVDVSSTIKNADSGIDGNLNGTLDALQLDVSGQWVDDTVKFDVEASTDAWPGFLPIVHYAPEDLAPFKLSARGNYSPAAFKLETSSISTPSHEAQANASIDLAEGTSVAVAINAQRLRIPLIPAGTEAEPETAPKNDDEPPPLLSTEPLDWSWLDTLNLTASLNTDVLQLEDAVFNAFSLDVHAKDGALNMQTGSGDPENPDDGGFAGTLELARAGDGVDTTADFHLNRIALETFGFVPQEELTGGRTEVLLNLRSNGASPADLGAHAEGEMYAIVEEAVLQNDMVEIIGSDIIMEALEKLNPFVKDDPSTNLECALVRFEATDGVLKSDDQLVIETDKMEIVGSGSINLANEALKITFSPSAKSGVGVNAGSLVSFLALGGTIRDPGLTVDALGTLKTGASIGAAISTGGASLLAEGLIKRAANAGSACEAFRKNRTSADK